MPPPVEKGPQGLLLGIRATKAAAPCLRFDVFVDLRPDALPKVIGIHRVKFPTIVAVGIDEPPIAFVVRLIGCRE
jgi:hypothetical protein